MFELSVIPVEAILSFSTKMLVFLAGLAALIFVHELGHFLVARRVGVVVEKFSLGFGPKVFSLTRGGTEYLISAIPLGGYVKMKGEDYEESSTKEAGSFAAAPVHHRLAIAFAGPLFNILFAVVIYIVVYMVGVDTLGLTVGNTLEESPARAAGIQSGDKIIEIDGKPVLFWGELQKIVNKAPGKPLKFKVQRKNSEVIDLTITPEEKETLNLFGEKEKMGLIGITSYISNISYVEEGSAADVAGIKVGDRLLSIDDTPIRDGADFKAAAMENPGKELTFRVERDGVERVFPLTPESKTVKDPSGKEIEIGLVGIGLAGEIVLEQYGFFGAVHRALDETGRLLYLIAVSIKKLIVGSIPADTIGGPILIFQIYGQQAEQGFYELIRLTALLSINLGLLNLLPIPMLDGGHIFFFLIEIIKGKPLSEKSRERAQFVGLFMLISLMVFAFYNDIIRIIS